MDILEQRRRQEVGDLSSKCLHSDIVMVTGVTSTEQEQIYNISNHIITSSLTPIQFM